jgi:hypothetical protein
VLISGILRSTMSRGVIYRGAVPIGAYGLVLRLRVLCLLVPISATLRGVMHIGLRVK